MKQKLKIIIPLTILLLICIMAYGIYSKHAKKEKIEEQIQTIPPFAFTNIKTRQTFTDNNIEPNKVILIIHFHPECEICHEQIEEISKELEKFDNFQILLISNAEISEIESFAANNELTNEENITLLQDKDFIFNEIFGKSGVPTSLVYNAEGKLVKHFKGKINVKELLKYLDQ